MAYAKSRSVSMRAKVNNMRRKQPRGQCVLDGCGNVAVLGSFCKPCQQWWGRLRHMTQSHFLDYLVRCGRISNRKDFLGVVSVKPKEATAKIAANTQYKQEEVH